MRAANRLVLDASVAAKWHLKDEEYGDRALELLRRYQEGQLQLVAPYLINYELSNAFLIASRRRRIAFSQAAEAFREFADLGLPTASGHARTSQALDLAERYGCSFYDALYLALAEELGARLITADRERFDRLVQAVDYLLWIADYPEGRA